MGGMMATEQKYITVPNISFNLDQLLDIIRQLDEPARLQIAEVLTETLADSQLTTSIQRSAKPQQDTAHPNLSWRGGLRDLSHNSTSVALQHQSLAWWNV